MLSAIQLKSHGTPLLREPVGPFTRSLLSLSFKEVSLDLSSRLRCALLIHIRLFGSHRFLLGAVSFLLSLKAPAEVEGQGFGVCSHGTRSSVSTLVMLRLQCFQSSNGAIELAYLPSLEQ